MISLFSISSVFLLWYKEFWIITLIIIFIVYILGKPKHLIPTPRILPCEASGLHGIGKSGSTKALNKLLSRAKLLQALGVKLLLENQKTQQNKIYNEHSSITKCSVVREKVCFHLIINIYNKFIKIIIHGYQSVFCYFEAQLTSFFQNTSPEMYME